MDVKLNITKVSKFMPDFSDLRDMTPEEAEAYERSLKRVYKPTGINIDDLMKEVDNAGRDKEIAE